MNQKFTQSKNSQACIKTPFETNRLQQKIVFLQNYCRAFKNIQTNSIVHIEFALN
ncbi:MAG: hypothetical protein M0R02_07705 [Bacteroidales bacterium]|jgi:hypothetical protein|nr:hypothetical protein [Bacteroidales bacterium]